MMKVAMILVAIILFPSLALPQVLEGKVKFTDEYRKVLYLNKMDKLDDFTRTSKAP